MNIVRQNADELVLQSKSPMVLVLIVVEVFSTVAAVVFLLATGLVSEAAGPILWGGVSVLLLTAVVVLGLAIPREETYAFHAASRSIMIQRKFLLRTQSEEFPFDHVQRVSCGTPQRPNGVVSLSLAGGRRCSVLPAWSCCGKSATNGNQQVVDTINQFLGLKVRESEAADPSAADTNEVEPVARL